ncbi:hypothetical protein GCM10023259_081320 [Thermocatellispora tengchongensis]
MRTREACVGSITALLSSWARALTGGPWRVRCGLGSYAPRARAGEGGGRGVGVECRWEGVGWLGWSGMGFGEIWAIWGIRGFGVDGRILLRIMLLTMTRSGGVRFGGMMGFLSE